jgi:glutamate/tyrosine decarboxylase-like PLP-dependent enzyme
MTKANRPILDAADDLTEAADIDLNAALSTLIGQRFQSPIIRPSRAVDVAALLDLSHPAGGDSLEQLVTQINHATERYPRRNTHPGFFGWVAPSGLPSDPLAHAMVSVLNENVGGYWASPVGTTIEKTVIRWLADLVDFPRQAQGVFLSGGSMANMCGIASACAKRFGAEFRSRGLAAFSNESRPMIICSSAAHFSIRRAAVMLGIGSDNIVSVDTDDQFRMRVDALEAALDEHDNIICVVASAGTTNTGAIDPLAQIADLCGARDVWLHVDAAYGAGGLMSAELKPRYRGIERADSVVMDMHKWFYQALAGSLLLYREPSWARQLFTESSDYLRWNEDDSPEQFAFFSLSPELSRRFRALPFYISMRHYGLERLGRNALHNVQCAEYLAERVRAEPDLELITAPQLSILCFRMCPAGLEDDAVDRLNTAIRDRIQLQGDYLISPTLVNGRPVLRVCIINHATRAEHMDGLLDSILHIGRELVALGDDPARENPNG